MYLLRHFPKSKPTQGVQAPNDAPRLPPELFIHIASFVDRSIDLAALCMVSKVFTSFCIPMLYKTICIYGTQTKVHLRLYLTLQDPRFSNLVTELSLSLRRGTICGRYNHKGVLSSFRKRCTCDAYNQVLGEAIFTLSALEALMLYCTLCYRRHDHEYLFHARVPMLRRFAFHCYNSGQFSDTLPAKSILLAPFMSKVTALALECHASLISSSLSRDDQVFIDNPDVAPQLHTLQYGSVYGHNDLLAGLLAERPIQRLCIDTFIHHKHGAYAPSLQSSLWRSPGTLSHLFSVDLLQWLPRAMTETVKPYRNLKSIGTITGSQCEEDAAFHEMDVLAPLDRLEAIEINQNRAEDGTQTPLILNPGVLFNPTHHFIDLLEARHPLLRRVLLIARREIAFGPGMGPRPVLWEKVGGWSSRSAPYIEYWGVVNDK